MSDKQYFIGLCIDVRTCKFIPLAYIKFNLDYGMYLCICLCRICIVFACILFILHIYVWYTIV